ncbi:calcium/sodium antiporter [Oceanibium sediminis]|uniref:calcium/sodium antiporter n=1 Tax=Oceanibium sediminis TaxID=2026339 RepID=UPI000DD2E1D9|nr:calcium/sodium antiporter [Oceanibium sediminis]
MEILLAVVGLVILVIGGDILVRGAVALSLRLGVPALIVSLTIVAFGTSAPELLISIKAALENAPGLAFGNIVGSNIANVMLVLGVPAVMAGIDPKASDTRSSYLQMLAATVVLIALMFLGPMHIWHGLVLLALLAAMLGHTMVTARRARSATLDPDFDPDEAASVPTWRAVVYIAIGIVSLPIGADILVDAARDIALQVGVSDEVIGLTLVAIGTSLPELATTVMAAIRRQADVILGNVIGSNMLNILAIMGVTSLFGPLAVDPHLLKVDVWVMLVTALMVAPLALWKLRMSRGVGLAFLGLYAVYMVTLF